MPRSLGCMLLASSLCANVAYAQDENAPITVGQMSEEAAAATRLFRDEKWAEAAIALEADRPHHATKGRFIRTRLWPADHEERAATACHAVTAQSPAQGAPLQRSTQ